MNPKEKANEMLSKFIPFAHWDEGSSNNNIYAKQCAMIAVEEIICMVSEDDGIWITTLQYWNQVKTEIEKP